MDLASRLAMSYYRTIAVINEEHNVFLVQHQSSHRIFIKKILDVYNIDVYDRLYLSPIPGTPRIIEFCEEDDRLTLIEEYISGIPLSEKISSGDIDTPDILCYSYELCSILEKLHTLTPPVIHRDIKPSNIIITNYNHAVLLDFNAAKQFTSPEQNDTILLGTHGYAAPEQYGFGSSSPQTDMYSLGIVLKEMMSVCYPASYPASTVTSGNTQGRMSNATGDTGNSTEGMDDILAGLSAIVDKCTQIDPKERYSSVSILKDEFAALLNQSPITSAASSARYLLPPGFRSHTPWKMLVSSIVYAFLFWICLTSELGNTYGARLWLERIFILAMFLSVIFVCFNYMNIQSIVPLCRHQNRLVRYAGIILLEAAILLLMFVLFLAEGIIFGL